MVHLIETSTIHLGIVLMLVLFIRIVVIDIIHTKGDFHFVLEIRE